MNKKIVMLLADGFEETEAIATADILVRLGFELCLVGVGNEHVTGGHGITLKTDRLITEIELDDFAALVLPGGMPGSMNLRDSGAVIDLVQNAEVAGKVVAAICAAPMVLAQAGILAGKRVTCYPGFEEHLNSAICTGARCEQDGNIITGQGVGASFEFGAKIALALGIEEAEIEQLFKAMLIAK
ncbi:MAG: DJ-1/PfpI family protein [Victivallaceae bacterium]|nr:DJ-1/PfpI family protein [Victivallaceae bacterium]